MELTDSFLALLQSFDPVFTAPTYQTFVVIVTGWIISQRHRYVTEVIFSSGHVGDGHWSRFHRFFSYAAWDIDTFSMRLAKSGRHDPHPRASLPLGLFCIYTLCSQTRADLYALACITTRSSSSRAKSLVSWGHDWVVLTLIVAFPVWAPSKVFALPIAMRLYRNRQGLTKGKKNPKGKKGQQKPTKPKHDPNHRTRPELALELIIMVAQWFPNEEIQVIFQLATATGGQKHPVSPAAQRSPHQPCASQWSTLRAVRLQERKTQRTGPQERGPVARHEAMGRRSGPTVD